MAKMCSYHNSSWNSTKNNSVANKERAFADSGLETEKFTKVFSIII